MKVLDLMEEEFRVKSIVKVDSKKLFEIRRYITSLLHVKNEHLKLLEDYVRLFVLTRMIKVIDGLECSECYDAKVLEGVKSVLNLLVDIVLCRIPITQDLKVPVKVLKALDVANINILQAKSLRAKPGSIIYVPLAVLPPLLQLGVIEVLK